MQYAYACVLKSLRRTERDSMERLGRSTTCVAGETKVEETYLCALIAHNSENRYTLFDGLGTFDLCICEAV
jgi:hypothetical protein